MRIAIYRKALALCLACLCSGLLQARGQTQRTGIEPATQYAAEELPNFEVATIKPNRSGDPGYSMSQPLGRFGAKNVTLEEMVQRAYYLPADQISGGPSWFESLRYDIEAKMSEAQIEETEKLDPSQQEKQLHLMLQSLLADRFKLSVIHRPKELKSYALMVAKGGAKLRVAGMPEAAEPGRPMNTGGFPMIWFQERNCSAGALAGFLTEQFHRPVVDQTGLKESYDIKFVVPIDPQADRESLIRSALEDQLGLKVAALRVTVDTIVVEHAEAPSAN